MTHSRRRPYASLLAFGGVLLLAGLHGVLPFESAAVAQTIPLLTPVAPNTPVPRAPAPAPPPVAPAAPAQAPVPAPAPAPTSAAPPTAAPEDTTNVPVAPRPLPPTAEPPGTEPPTRAPAPSLTVPPATTTPVAPQPVVGEVTPPAIVEVTPGLPRPSPTAVRERGPDNLLTSPPVLAAVAGLALTVGAAGGAWWVWTRRRPGP